VARYRRLPLECEAFQMTPEAYLKHGTWPDWLTALADESGVLVAVDSRNPFFWVLAATGQKVSLFDFVVRYSTGAIGVMKPDDFLAQFELAEDA
jgi:hypothetical protein